MKGAPRRTWRSRPARCAPSGIRRTDHWSTPVGEMGNIRQMTNLSDSELAPRPMDTSLKTLSTEARERGAATAAGAGRRQGHLPPHSESEARGRLRRCPATSRPGTLMIRCGCPVGNAPGEHSPPPFPRPRARRPVRFPATTFRRPLPRQEGIPSQRPYPRRRTRASPAAPGRGCRTWGRPGPRHPLGSIGSPTARARGANANRREGRRRAIGYEHRGRTDGVGVLCPTFSQMRIMSIRMERWAMRNCLRMLRAKGGEGVAKSCV